MTIAVNKTIVYTSEQSENSSTPKLPQQKTMIKSKLYFDTNEPVETEHSISLIADFDGNVCKYHI